MEYIQRGNIITTRTFSKIYGLAGLRIGYGVSNAQIIELMNKVREPFNVNSLAQAAAVAALDDEKFVLKIRKHTDQGRKQLYEGFQKLELDYIPSATNFILVHFGKKAEDIYQKLLKAGLITRYMSPWGLNEYIRITIGTKRQNKELLKTISDML